MICATSCVVLGLKNESAAVTTSSDVAARARLNLQRDGNKAKPYQVRQVRIVILQYGLADKL